MIAATSHVRAAAEWIPVDDPAIPGGSGWLGQVPPPDPTQPPTRPAGPDPVTGYESPAQAREDGWLGQVPPPPPARAVEAARAAPVADCLDGEDWLGQVPPPEAKAPTPAAAPAPTYANPHLAPEPWKADPVLPGTDPTLW